LGHELVNLVSRSTQEAQILRKQRRAEEDEVRSDSDEQYTSGAEKLRGDRHRCERLSNI
jgi:hypothetical protein